MIPVMSYDDDVEASRKSKVPILDMDTIFVSLASFRDENCWRTIHEVYREAQYPFRIFCGVVDQRKTDTEEFRRYSCVPFFGSRADNFTASYVIEEERRRWLQSGVACSSSVFCPVDNVRIRVMTDREARGPTYGRYVAALMYRGEMWLLMIDSHVRFPRHFDVALIHNVKLLPVEKGVLSHYPPEFETFNDTSFDVDRSIPLAAMCKADYLEEYDVLRHDVEWVNHTPLLLPLLQPFTAAGFLFGDAQLLQDVPMDPYLPFLFDGEEILYTARLYTHGWNSYMPAQALCYHLYDRRGVPHVWTVEGNNWTVYEETARRRVHYFLNTTRFHNKSQPLLEEWEITEDVTREEGKFGLGTERSLKSFYEWICCDSAARQCKRTRCDEMVQLSKKMLLPQG